MNRIEKYLFEAGTFREVENLGSPGRGGIVGAIPALRRWMRQSDEPIPFACEQFVRLHPCHWSEWPEGENLPVHPRIHMTARAFLFWLGDFYPLYSTSRPTSYDCSPYGMDQAYFEFYRGFVKLSQLPGNKPKMPNCTHCGEPVQVPEDSLCAECEAGFAYAALEGEFDPIGDDNDPYDDDTYDPFYDDDANEEGYDNE